MKNIVVGITGASGSIYGLRLIEELLRAEKDVTVLLTNAGDNLQHDGLHNFFSPVASGSSAPDAVVICPCSMGTLGRIAAGLSDNLLERVADVALKEQKKLLLVPRETPFNQIHLENLLRLSKAGAQILPAMPGFYQQPETVADLVDFVVGKILDSLNIEHQLFSRWGCNN